MSLNSMVLYWVFEKARHSTSESVQTLLEHKHLYQNVEADISVDRIAFNSGKTLASLFYLRTLIEQYFRRVLAVDKDKKVRGEDLARDYRKLLDEDFPMKFDTLGNIYDSLSDALHAACDDEELYTSARADIEKHFELLVHFPISQMAEA